MSCCRHSWLSPASFGPSDGSLDNYTVCGGSLNMSFWVWVCNSVFASPGDTCHDGHMACPTRAFVGMGPAENSTGTSGPPVWASLVSMCQAAFPQTLLLGPTMSYMVEHSYVLPTWVSLLLLPCLSLCHSFPVTSVPPSLMMTALRA